MEEQRDIETSENVRFISVETTEDAIIDKVTKDRGMQLNDTLSAFLATVRCSPTFPYALADQGTGCLGFGEYFDKRFALHHGMDDCRLHSRR